MASTRLAGSSAWSVPDGDRLGRGEGAAGWGAAPPVKIRAGGEGVGRGGTGLGAGEAGEAPSGAGLALGREGMGPKALMAAPASGQAEEAASRYRCSSPVAAEPGGWGAGHPAAAAGGRGDSVGGGFSPMQ